MLAPRPAAAQLAPVGGHYAGRPSDTGYAGQVGPTGSYQISVPLDLPPAKGGLPIPLQISYTEREGAAGLGWDVPLSYIQREVDFAHRRPTNGAIAPHGRERVTLVLDGRRMLLAPTATGWAVQNDAPDLVIRNNSDGSWVMYDGQGRTYRFALASPLLDGAGLWHLASITASDGHDVSLTYNVQSDPRGLEIDLTRVTYNNATSGGDSAGVFLEYDEPSPLSLAIVNSKLFIHTHLLKTLRVFSFGLPQGLTEVRDYHLSYQSDPDTKHSRLSDVQMTGRVGTPEASKAILIASYSYGSATTQGALAYHDKGNTYASNEIAVTSLDVNAHPATGVGYVTNFNLTDITGDGQPEFLNGWSPVVRISVPPLPIEMRTTHDLRYDFHQETIDNEMLWRQAIDFNGDGRIDVIDAQEVAGAWVVYLSVPDRTAFQGTGWQRIELSTTQLADHLRGGGLWDGDDYLPLALRSTVKDLVYQDCAKWNGSAWVEFTGSGCPAGGVLASIGPESTLTQWELKDVNGDGFPDVVLNSGGVVSVSQLGSLPVPTHPVPDPVHVMRTVTTGLKDGANNIIFAALNIAGVHLTGDSPFTLPFQLRRNSPCGVARWEVLDDEHQQLSCSLVDVNGDGMLDYVDYRATYLGTGAPIFATFFTPFSVITLPGPLQIQKNPALELCKRSPVPNLSTEETAGLRDLTGDGIPDYITSNGTSFQVAIGHGTGFAAPIPISVAHPGDFIISFQLDNCAGNRSSTVHGLFDIDGDGKADVLQAGFGFVTAQSVIGSAGVVGAPEAGRLVRVVDGYGAQTDITYRSAKQDTTTPHNVPFPEIVVTAVQTTGTQGRGGTLAKTSYAYGGADLIFDPAQDAFIFPGYQRSVVLTAPSADLATATITDAYAATSRLDPFGIVPPNGGTDLALPVELRYRLHWRVGKTRDVAVLTGSVGTDPWALLATNLSTDNRRIANTHYEWDTRLLASIPDFSGPDPCWDMVLPYDWVTSSFYDLFHGGYNPCLAYGFGFTTSVVSWHGEPGQAPPSPSNVVTRFETKSVDGLGRVLSTRNSNDDNVSQDDVCTTTTYATPTGADVHVLTAIASQTITDCDTRTLAVKRWEYDGLPAGSVSAGLVTSQTTERRSDTGALLATIRDFDATYGTLGTLHTVTKTREDGATQTTTIDYDFLGMPTLVTTSAPGVATTQNKIGYDTSSTLVLSVTDANGTVHGTVYDGFDRPTQTTIQAPGGAVGVLATTSYAGFAIGEPAGRVVTNKVFTDAVDPTLAASAPGRVSTVTLDELGRSRKETLNLGVDYAADNQLVVSDRTYDVFGRVAFEADPHSAADSAVYGTTHYYNADGTPSCVIRGRGKQAFTNVTDESNEVFPTCFQHSFQFYTEIRTTQDAAALPPGSPQAGVVKRLEVSAIGRPFSSSTWQGSNRLELAAYAHDGLGHLASMTRYQDPANAAKAVSSSWHTDSLGQVQELDEPGSAPQLNTYSNWGELIETRRNLSEAGAAMASIVANQYDALGRLIHSEERKNSIVDPDTINDYSYDEAVSPAPQVNATYVLGRLAVASSPTGSTAFSYDSLGHVNARVFNDATGGLYVEKHATHADGTPASLDLMLPDTGFAEEHVDYGYDSAGRPNLITYISGAFSHDMYIVPSYDALGHPGDTLYGAATLHTEYAPSGRRLLNAIGVFGSQELRTVRYWSYDPVGRVRSKDDSNDFIGFSTTSYTYDALGRLNSGVRSGGNAAPFDQQFTYDPLGNILSLTSSTGASATRTSLTYQDGDRDRICHIGYANHAGTSCNVVYDQFGNVIEQPTRTGTRELSFFADGKVRTASDGSTDARFQYDAFGQVQELTVTSGTSADVRHDRRYGELIAWRDELVNGAPVSTLTRAIPGPNGVLATRHGANGAWTYAIGEQNGARFVVDENGLFVQDIDYTPFGEPTSTGAPPGGAAYHREQWNGGDFLAALGVSQLGARLYDPAIGRFVSRDPLLIPRTAATTNPYAFAVNDPINSADPSGLDCDGVACQQPCWFCTPTTPGGSPGGAPPANHNNGGGPPAPPKTPVTPPNPVATAELSRAAQPTLTQADVFRIGLTALAAEQAANRSFLDDHPRLRLLGQLAWILQNPRGSVIGCLGSGGCSTPFDPPEDFGVGSEQLVVEDVPQSSIPDDLPRGVGPVDGPNRSVRIVKRWAARRIGDPACRVGCEEVAAQIKEIIGGEIKTIVPSGSGRILGAYRGKDLSWFYHVVVVKDGLVYDAFTGHKGLAIDAYKALWKYADGIDFGF